MSLSWPNHPITLADWEAMPEDESLRLELAEGVLVMSPFPFPWHQKASNHISNRLDEQLPRTLVALVDVEVLLAADPPTIRVPDVLVTATAVYETNPRRLTAADVRVAVEILSTGTRRVDRVLKYSEYADAGIPRYWIVDLEAGPELTAYVLVDGAYELAGRHTGPATLDVDGHPVTLDLDALTRR
jgi:Uma2 family endonuclease